MPRRSAAAAAVRCPPGCASRWRPSREPRPPVRSLREPPSPPRKPSPSSCPTCPSVPVPGHSTSFVGSPDPRQRPFRPGHPPLSGRLCGGRWRRSQHRGHRVPVTFRLPAFASRVVLHPLEHRAALTDDLPEARSRLDSIGVFTFHMRQVRPGWMPSEPRGRWCAPARPNPSGRHLPPSNGRSLFSRWRIPSRGSADDEASSRVHVIHPSGLPQPVTPGWNEGPWALPRASHPTVTRDARRGGDGPHALDRALHLRHSSNLLR